MSFVTKLAMPSLLLESCMSSSRQELGLDLPSLPFRVARGKEEVSCSCFYFLAKPLGNEE